MRDRRSNSGRDGRASGGELDDGQSVGGSDGEHAGKECGDKRAHSFNDRRERLRKRMRGTPRGPGTYILPSKVMGT